MTLERQQYSRDSLFENYSVSTESPLVQQAQNLLREDRANISQIARSGINPELTRLINSPQASPDIRSTLAGSNQLMDSARQYPDLFLRLLQNRDLSNFLFSPNGGNAERLQAIFSDPARRQTLSQMLSSENSELISQLTRAPNRQAFGQLMSPFNADTLSALFKPENIALTRWLAREGNGDNWNIFLDSSNVGTAVDLLSELGRADIHNGSGSRPLSQLFVQNQENQSLLRHLLRNPDLLNNALDPARRIALTDLLVSPHHHGTGGRPGWLANLGNEQNQHVIRNILAPAENSTSHSSHNHAAADSVPRPVAARAEQPMLSQNSNTIEYRQADGSIIYYPRQLSSTQVFQYFRPDGMAVYGPPNNQTNHISDHRAPYYSRVPQPASQPQYHLPARAPSGC